MNIVDLTEAFFAIVGVGAILHFYAYAIGWGWIKGRSKIITNTEHNVNLKTTYEYAQPKQQ